MYLVLLDPAFDRFAIKVCCDSGDFEGELLSDRNLANDVQHLGDMLVAPVAAGGAYQQLHPAVVAGLQHGSEVSDIALPAAGHLVQAQLVGTSVRAARVDDDGGWAKLVDAEPEVVAPKAVSENGTWRQNGEVGLCEATHGGESATWDVVVFCCCCCCCCWNHLCQEAYTSFGRLYCPGMRA